MFLQYIYDYDSQTNLVFEHSCIEWTQSNTQTNSRTAWEVNGDKKWKKCPYWLPILSYLPSNWSTSTSTIAASRYFFMLRTTFIATVSFPSLSQHSRTCPNVPVFWHSHNHIMKNCWWTTETTNHFVSAAWFL